MSISIPTDQVPVIQGINVSNDIRKTVTYDGSTPGVLVVETVTQKRGTRMITVTFRLYKDADDIHDSDTPTWGTGSWTIPMDYADYEFVGANVEIVNGATFPQICNLIETWQEVDALWVEA